VNVQAQEQTGRGRPLPRKAKGLREQAWWLIRQRGRFSINTLLETLATGQEADAPGNLLKYISQLENVGVVKRSKHRLPADPHVIGSTGYTVWMLQKDLGRSAPVWRKRDRAMYDPNANQLLTPTAAAQEASDE
jgi:hypothetical protein